MRNMEDQLTVDLRAESVFASHSLVKRKLMKLCPTLDLLAIADRNESVNVYRFDGQFAFGRKRPNANSEVLSICWKYDGMSRSLHFCTLSTFSYYVT